MKKTQSVLRSDVFFASWMEWVRSEHGYVDATLRTVVADLALLEESLVYTLGQKEMGKVVGPEGIVHNIAREVPQGPTSSGFVGLAKRMSAIYDSILRRGSLKEDASVPREAHDPHKVEADGSTPSAGNWMILFYGANKKGKLFFSHIVSDDPIFLRDRYWQAEDELNSSLRREDIRWYRLSMSRICGCTEDSKPPTARTACSLTEAVETVLEDYWTAEPGKQIGFITEHEVSSDIGVLTVVH